MDQCTHEVRTQYWKNIIAQCNQRPEGQTAKQWLDTHGICKQTYYRWQRLIRREIFARTSSASGMLPSSENTEVAFAEIPIPAQTPGRKNWVTINTIRGAQASAIIYSVTETARANDLNVYCYIRYLLTELMKRKDADGNIDQTKLEPLMPRSKRTAG